METKSNICILPRRLSTVVVYYIWLVIPLVEYLSIKHLEKEVVETKLFAGPARDVTVNHLTRALGLDETLRKRLKGDRYKKILECVLAAVKYRRTATGAEDSLRQAINVLPKTGQQSRPDGTLNPKQEDVRYIWRELWQNLRLAGLCYRDHSQILLQVKTTNAFESFHAQLKLGATGSMQRFTLKGKTQHIFDVMERYDKRHRKTERMFRASVHPKAAEHQ